MFVFSLNSGFIQAFNIDSSYNKAFDFSWLAFLLFLLSPMGLFTIGVMLPYICEIWVFKAK
jgi:hypothetical protein